MERPDQYSVNNVRILYPYAVDNNFNIQSPDGMRSVNYGYRYVITGSYTDYKDKYPVELDRITITDFVNNPTTTLLTTAALINDHDTVFGLLDFLPSKFINYMDIYGNNLFILACIVGYRSMVKKLLELSDTHKKRDTVERQDVDTEKGDSESGVINVNRWNAVTHSLYTLAAAAKYEGLWSEQIISNPGDHETNILHKSADTINIYSQIIRHIQAHGMKPLDSPGSPANFALKECNPQLASLFCDDFSNDGRTRTSCFFPITLGRDIQDATENNNIPVLEYYLSNYDNYGLNSAVLNIYVFWCVEKKYYSAIELVLSNYNKDRLNLGKLLCYAIRLDNITTVSLLLKYSADPNDTCIVYGGSGNRNKTTRVSVIRYALDESKNMDIAELLFSYGAKLSIFERIYYRI